jgi:hypothetical protein
LFLKHLGFTAFPITKGFSIFPSIFPHNNTVSIFFGRMILLVIPEKKILFRTHRTII